VTCVPNRRAGRTCSGFAALILVAGQALPPPRDGDIRALHWELRNETEVWLTLEPKSSAGKPGPPGMILTLTRQFQGKHPTRPATDVELRAYAGFLWAPRVEFWLVLDGDQRINLAPKTVFGLSTGAVSDYLPATISIGTLKQMAEARRVAGNALGFEFELTESQRLAIRAFVERALSDDPAGLKRR
jgi:hypothetical protein